MSRHFSREGNAMTFGLHPLLLVTFFPLIGFVIIAFMKEEQKDAIRWTALVTSLITFGLSLLVLAGFNPQQCRYPDGAASSPG